MTPDPQDDPLEAGRRMFASGMAFFYAAQALDHLPEPQGIEVALAGRSNVGKSTLINAIAGERALARVASSPGRTRQLNFFRVGSGPLVMVDMPGYGFAVAPRAVKRDWQGLMFNYLRGRPNLRRVLLLLDARIEFKPSDIAVMELLDQAAVAFQIVLTKADKMAPSVLGRKQAAALALARGHPAALQDILTTSGETGMGIDELRAVLASLAA